METILSSIMDAAYVASIASASYLWLVGRRRETGWYMPPCFLGRFAPSSLWLHSSRPICSLPCNFPPSIAAQTFRIPNMTRIGRQCILLVITCLAFMLETRLLLPLNIDHCCSAPTDWSKKLGYLSFAFDLDILVE
jgi:hypothetical protein